MNKTSYPKEKIKVLLLEGVHPVALKIFDESGYLNLTAKTSAMSEAELLEVIDEVHLLGIRSKTQVNEAVIEKAKKLLAIGCFCIGTNQVHMGAATAAGIAVFNSPFSNTRSVAELVIGEAILLIRRIVEKNTLAHQGIWMKDSKNCYEVRGKTLGIIGYGHIGSQVSVLAESMGFKVIYFDIDSKLPLGNASPAKTLEQLLSVSDVVTLHVPGTAITKNMINEERISHMKNGSILINLSRGDVIDGEAVKKAILDKKLGGLAVDVFPNEPSSKDEAFFSPLQNLPNVLLSPHVGGSTVEAQENIGVDVSTKLISFTETGSSVGSLSIPPLSLSVQQNTSRMLHIHKNLPGVLSEINSILSEHDVNISAQYLKTNQQIGYVVFDVDKETSPRVLEELREVKHTIRVRSVF
jgi:D-3-phosphoglycerate dehydrogenase